jgi:hypothetical protein
MARSKTPYDDLRCIACSRQIEPELVSISHTIHPGGSLCSDCGRRESLDPVWADGLRRGVRRAEAASRAMRIVEENL